MALGYEKQTQHWGWMFYRSSSVSLEKQTPRLLVVQHIRIAEQENSGREVLDILPGCSKEGLSKASQMDPLG